MIYCSKSLIVSRKLLQDWLNGWNLALQAAWYIRHAHWARLCYIPFAVAFVNSMYDIIVDSQFHKFMVGRSLVFYIFS